MLTNIYKKMSSSAATSTKTVKTLLMLDCDHTIIDGNSDTWVWKLLPGGVVPGPIKKRYKTEHKSWTIYMGEIFEHMHSIGIKEEAVRDSIAEIPLVHGMKEFLDYQQSDPNLDCIVVSDANSYFIDVILRSRDYLSGIGKIFTNQAEFDSQGCLKIHFSNPHTCPRQCPKNLCKQTAIQAFMDEQKQNGVTYDRVCVIGDGGNDLCPCLSLGEGDFVFPRKGYTLINRLQELEGRKNGLVPPEGDRCLAKVVPWDSATQIVDVLNSAMKS